MSNIDERIMMRRKQLGLSDVEVAKQSDLSIDEYWDVEHHADEIFDIPVRVVKKLCQILQCDLLSLLEISCDFCTAGKSYSQDYRLPRNELIRKRRTQKQLTIDELSDQVGFAPIEIQKLEADPEHVENWPFEFVQTLAEKLEIPLPILLGVKCSRCGQ